MSVQVAFEELKKSQPNLRARDAAAELGVSEAEIVEAQVGSRATRLRPQWKEILFACRELGEVMALTRNNAVVLEIDGEFLDLSFEGSIGLALEPGFDLRIFLFAWKFGFALEHESARGTMRSLQFFDQEGVAVFKIWLRSGSSIEAYERLVQRFKSNDEPPVQPQKISAPILDESAIDLEGFHAAWRSLRDTHDFFPMLRTFKLPRLEAVRRAPPEYAERVPLEFLRDLLDRLTREDFEIMFFVGSRGMIEIFTGKIQNTRHSETWWNVMDRGINLHINHTLLKEAWIVKKPTDDGVVTALEVFDSEDNLALSIFGARKPGIPELLKWREALSGRT